MIGWGGAVHLSFIPLLYSEPQRVRVYYCTLFIQFLFNDIHYCSNEPCECYTDYYYPHAVCRLLLYMRLYRMYARNLRVAMCTNSPDGLYDNLRRVGRCNAFIYLYSVRHNPSVKKESSESLSLFYLLRLLLALLTSFAVFIALSSFCCKFCIASFEPLFAFSLSIFFVRCCT